MWRREEGGGVAGGRGGGGEVVRAVGLVERAGWGGQWRETVGGHGGAGPRPKLHQYKSNDPRGLEGLIYECLRTI